MLDSIDEETDCVVGILEKEKENEFNKSKLNFTRNSNMRSKSKLLPLPNVRKSGASFLLSKTLTSQNALKKTV